MYSIRSLITLIALSPFLVSAQTSEEPQVLVEERFTDGELVGGSDEKGASWFEGSGSTAAIVDDTGGLNGGNALQHLSRGNFSRTTGVFQVPVALANAGDMITVELRLRMTRFSDDDNGGIRFGLHHDNGSPVDSSNAGDNWTDITGGWDGYYLRGGVGTTAGMNIFKEVPGASGGAMGGSGDISMGSGSGWALNDMAEHAVRIEIIRMENHQNQVNFYWDGEFKQGANTATAGGEMFAYTNFTVGTGSTEVDLVVDDVIISLAEATIEPPEPIDLEARLADWTLAGVQGGIPDYTNVVDFVDYGGDPTGQLDNSVLLTTLVYTLTENTVIYFPAGVYRFTRRVILDKNQKPTLRSVIFRGAGTGLTKLLFEEPNEENEGLFQLSGQVLASDIRVLDGLTRGSTTITLQDASSALPGRWLWIRQDNDPVAMATNRSISDYSASIDNQTGWAKRTVGQVVKIAAVDGDSVTLDRPLNIDYTWPNRTATIIRPLTGVGFEDLTIDNGLNTASRSNISFNRATNCWIRNVHSLMGMRNHVQVWGSANITIRDSYFNDAWRHDGGGHGYGTLLNAATTNCLVENNVFRNLRHAMIWKEGANGNVFAYNYSTDGNQSDTLIAKDISGHGHYAYANLIEGNIAQFIHAADYWGPIGPNNMFLRNRTTHERILIEDNTRDQSIIGNELTSPTAPFVVVDSSSSGAYVHGNNEGGLLQWRPDDEQVVAQSYFYAEQPAFWNISDPWPSMGPEYVAGTNTIPAKYRWDNGLMDEFVLPVPVIESQPVSVAAVAGGLVSFGVQAVSGESESYQWQKDGVNLIDGGHVSGAKSAILVLTGVSTDDSGTYTVVVTNAFGPTESQPALLSLWSADDGILSNLSTRGQVMTDNDILIAGFVLAGSESKTLLIRGIGPSLGQFVGQDKVLVDSTLAIYSGGSEILSNDDWSGQDVVDLSAQVGAFALEPGSKDAVIRAELGVGAYSVHLAGKGATGLGLVELYDGSTGSASQLKNISTRGWVGTGDAIMVPGLVVSGSSRNLLIRGVGPQLAESFGFNPDDVLPDPVLTLVDADGNTVATNDNWGEGADAAMIVMVSQQVGAFALDDGSTDAVLLFEVDGGLYTALVADKNGGEGIAIVEVYAVP